MMDEQVLGAAVDVGGVLLVGRRAHRPVDGERHHVREADDGVERRAQLVAHVGEELGLGAAGLLGRFLGRQDRALALAEVGDVAGGAAIAEMGAAVGIEHRHGADQEDLVAAVLGADRQREVAERRHGLQPRQQPIGDLAVGGERQDRGADQLARMKAGGALGAVRHDGEEAVGIDLPHPVGDQADDILQPLLRREQPPRHVGLVGNHLHEAGERGLLPRAVGQLGVAGADGDGAAVGGAARRDGPGGGVGGRIVQVRMQEALRLRCVHQLGGERVVAVIGPDHGAVRLLEEHRRLGSDRSFGQQHAGERLGEIVAFPRRRVERIGSGRRWRHRRAQDTARGRWRSARRNSGLTM